MSTASFSFSQTTQEDFLAYNVFPSADLTTSDLFADYATFASSSSPVPSIFDDHWSASSASPPSSHLATPEPCASPSPAIQPITAPSPSAFNITAYQASYQQAKEQPAAQLADSLHSRAPVLAPQHSAYVEEASPQQYLFQGQSQPAAVYPSAYVAAPPMYQQTMPQPQQQQQPMIITAPALQQQQQLYYQQYPSFVPVSAGAQVYEMVSYAGQPTGTFYFLPTASTMPQPMAAPSQFTTFGEYVAQQPAPMLQPLSNMPSTRVEVPSVPAFQQPSHEQPKPQAAPQAQQPFIMSVPVSAPPSSMGGSPPPVASMSPSDAEGESDEEYQPLPGHKKSRSVGSNGSSTGKAQTKRFVCPHDGCGRAFARNFNMQSHLKSHLGIRDFDCPYCNKKFSRRHDRARHCSAVHGQHNVT